MRLIHGSRLSPQQRRGWGLRSAAPECCYCTQAVVAISGPLDLTRLGDAVAPVVAHHEILRTTFQTADALTLPVQVVADAVAVPISTLDLRGLVDAQPALELLALE